MVFLELPPIARQTTIQVSIKQQGAADSTSYDEEHNVLYRRQYSRRYRQSKLRWQCNTGKWGVQDDTMDKLVPRIAQAASPSGDYHQVLIDWKEREPISREIVVYTMKEEMGGQEPTVVG